MFTDEWMVYLAHTEEYYWISNDKISTSVENVEHQKRNYWVHRLNTISKWNLNQMFSQNLFSAGKSVRLKHLLTDYSEFLLFTLTINLTCPHQWVSSTYCSDFHILHVMPYISKVHTDNKLILKMQTYISIVYAPRIPKLSIYHCSLITWMILL